MSIENSNLRERAVVDAQDNVHETKQEGKVICHCCGKPLDAILMDCRRALAAAIAEDI